MSEKHPASLELNFQRILYLKTQLNHLFLTFCCLFSSLYSFSQVSDSTKRPDRHRVHRMDFSWPYEELIDSNLNSKPNETTIEPNPSQSNQTIQTNKDSLDKNKAFSNSAVEVFKKKDLDSIHTTNSTICIYPNNAIESIEKVQSNRTSVHLALATSVENGFSSDITSFTNSKPNRIDLSNLKFKGIPIDFYEETFNRTLNFRNSTFQGFADFRRTIINDTIDFYGANFDSCFASFQWANFQNLIVWGNCTLPDTLDFSHVLIKFESDFSLADFQEGKICNIDLCATDLSKVKLDYKHFRLYFLDDMDVDQICNEYERVYRDFKDKGQLSDAKILGQEYFEYRYTAGKKGLSLLWGNLVNFTNKNWWGYGFEKELIIRNTFILFFLFWTINLFSFAYINSKIYEIPSIWKYFRKPQARFNQVAKKKSSVYLPIYASFFYTVLVFFGLRISIEKLQFQHRLGASYILVQYFIGLLCLAFLINYVVGQNSWDL